MLAPLSMVFFTNAQVNSSKNTDSLAGIYGKYQERNVQDSIIETIDRRLVDDGLSRDLKVQQLELKVDLLERFKRKDEAFSVAYAAYQDYCDGIAVVNCRRCAGISKKLWSFFASIGRYKEALNFARINCDKDIHDYYFRMSSLYTSSGYEDSAFFMVQEFTDIAEEAGDYRNIILARNLSGLINRRVGNYNKATREFKSAITIGRKEGYSDEKLHLLIGNLGFTYKLQGEFDSAMIYLQLDSKQSLLSGEMKSYAMTELAIAELELDQDSLSAAGERIERILDSSITYLSVDYLIKMDTMLQNLAVETNDNKLLELALRWSGYTQEKSDEMDYLKRKFDNDLQAERIEQMYQKILYEKELAEQRLKVLSAKKEQDDLRNLLITIILSAIAVISLILFWRFRSIQSKKSQINRMERDMLAQDKELLALRVKEENESVRRLALELSSKQEFAENLIDQLKERVTIDKQDLRWIKQFAENELETKSARIKIEEAIEGTNSMFYSELSLKHENLSEADLKLCAQVLLKLSNREISIARNIEISSVKKSKARLKKKLGLGPEDDLNEYLDSFL